MLIRPMMFRGVAAPAVATTLNPADKGAAMTLSEGNLRGVSSDGDGSQRPAARGTTSTNSRSVYFEMTNQGSGNSSVGVAVKSAPLQDGGFRGDTNEAAVFIGYLGRTYYDGTFTNYPASGDGVTIGIALDAAAGTFWVSSNGVWRNGDPGARTGGIALGAGRTWFPLFQSFNTNGAGLLNFGKTAFNYPIPSGFSPWG